MADFKFIVMPLIVLSLQILFSNIFTSNRNSNEDIGQPYLIERLNVE